MGQALSEPVVDKTTSNGEDDTLVYAVSEMQGWRISMEDAHTAILNLDEQVGDEKASFFAVYDGHGGAEAAKFAATKVHEHLAKGEDYKKRSYDAALKAAFLDTDQDLFQSKVGDPSGCTAVAALLVAGPAPEGAKQEKVARQIIVANAGDSRCVLSHAGEAKPLSFDHKPMNEDENARIVGAGGFVECGRVNGNLALSRAIGDFEFKRNPTLPKERQIVTADPEIHTHDVTGEEDFLILACDGIWDCLGNQEVVDFFGRGIARGKELSAICEALMNKCLAPESDISGVGCDNMTVCIVALLGGRTKEEWYAMVKSRFEDKVNWDDPNEDEQPAPVYKRNPNRAGGGGGFGGSSVLQALAGGLAGIDGQGQGGEGGGFRLAPGGLAAALGGGRFVLRPGEPDESGEMTYEAHVVDDDDSDEDDDQDSSGSHSEESKIGEISASDRPGLTHQPEIVESPKQHDEGSSSATPSPASSASQQAGESTTATTGFTPASTEVSGSSATDSSQAGGGGGSSSAEEGGGSAKVDVRPSTEGTGAEVQHLKEEAQEAAKEDEKMDGA